MKKLFFLASVLAACSNNEEVLAPTPTPEQESVNIDLRAMNYEGIMTLLSEQTSLKDVTFTDGDLQRSISELVASDNVDPEQANALIFNAANPQDSVDLTVTPQYVAVRLNVDGQRLAYMTFADKNQQDEIVALYEETVPATRSGASAVTRSVDNQSFKLNLTAMAEAMAAKAKAEKTSVLPERELKYQTPVVTRGWLFNLFKKIMQIFTPAKPPVTKTPTIDIYMLREKGANPLTHEMNWQVSDAISALKDVQSNVKFNVYIRDCDCKGTNNGYETLRIFTDWIESGEYRNTNGVFVLCRWGGYEWEGMGQAVGWSWIGDYDVNRDLQGCAVAATTVHYPCTVAHEIGHIFGANHPDDAWYDRLIGTDLMSYDLLSSWLNSGKHLDSENRVEIKKRMTLK